MNKKFVIAALVGALTFDQVMAARIDDDFSLVELDDEDDFTPDDFEDVENEAELGSYKKKDSSDDESTSDDERHEAYKVGDRNTAQSKKAKELAAKKKGKKKVKPPKKKKEDAPVVKAQTLESLQ